MNKFNLVDEAWIPILGGERVSLREALLNAPSFVRVEHASPLVTIAIYRFLLAVLHRALKGPVDQTQGREWYQTGKFPREPIESYLSKWKERFWLFHPQTPFYQMPDLPLEGFADPWTRLGSETGPGNTSFLTNPSLRERSPGPPPALDYAEAVCRLLEYQSFALGGLMKRFITSAPGAQAVQGILILAEGKNLFETLCLNLIPYPETHQAKDKPIWEKAPYSRKQLDVKEGFSESISGITSLYTWFARSVKLHQSDGRVSQVAIAAGVIATEGLEGLEPMFCYTFDKEGKPRSLAFREGRGLWRDFHALLPEPESRVHQASRVAIQARYILQNSTPQLPTYRVFGIAKDQAKVLGTHTESFSLPRIALSSVELAPFVKERLEEVERARSALYVGCKKLAEGLLSQGERKPLGSDVTNLVGSLPALEAFLPRVEREFYQVLDRLPTDEDAFWNGKEGLEQNWRSFLKRTAINSFRVAELAAGKTASALKASVEGRRFLLNELDKTLELTKEKPYVQA